MKVFQAAGFKNIGFPLENEGVPNSKHQKQGFSFGFFIFEHSGFENVCFLEEKHLFGAPSPQIIFFLGKINVFKA